MVNVQFCNNATDLLKLDIVLHLLPLILINADFNSTKHYKCVFKNGHPADNYRVETTFNDIHKTYTISSLNLNVIVAGVQASS